MNIKKFKCKKEYICDNTPRLSYIEYKKDNIYFGEVNIKEGYVDILTKNNKYIISHRFVINHINDGISLNKYFLSIGEYRKEKIKNILK